MSVKTLTVEQAYLAMFDYFRVLYLRTHSDEIGALLGDMSLLSDGGTADPAAWGDWMLSVQRAIDNEVDAELKLYGAPSENGKS